MIQSSELRIGNYIDFECSNTVESFHCSEGKITAIHTDHVYVNTIKVPRLGMLKTIPLTEEWLLKCGFNKISINYEKRGIAIWYSSQSRSYVFRYGHQSETIIEYVHQLQNLYFALTGEELEVML